MQSSFAHQVERDLPMLFWEILVADKRRVSNYCVEATALSYNHIQQALSEQICAAVVKEISDMDLVGDGYSMGIQAYFSFFRLVRIVFYAMDLPGNLRWRGTARRQFLYSRL